MAHDTHFLNDIVLLRNNPEAAARIESHAREGNPHAQYAMGLIFAEGRGVKVDLGKAWAWLTLAVMQGDRDAETLRNIVGIDMTDAEHQAGKTFAAELEQAITATSDKH